MRKNIIYITKQILALYKFWEKDYGIKQTHNPTLIYSVSFCPKLAQQPMVAY